MKSIKAIRFLLALKNIRQLFVKKPSFELSLVPRDYIYHLEEPNGNPIGNGQLPIN